MEAFRKTLKQHSEKNKDKVYIVRCTNYADSKQYFLKNGKFARFNVFNTKYAFANDKVRLTTLKKDGIYKATMIERNEKNINTYNI